MLPLTAITVPKPTRLTSANSSRSIRFGFCPICATIAAAGLVVGGGVALLCKNRDNPKNGLARYYGRELAEALLVKLQEIERTKPGVIQAFAQDPERQSKAMMNELGPDLASRLQTELDKKRRK